MPLDARLIGPCQDGVAGELAAIVADDHLRPTAFCDEPIKLPGNPHPDSDVSATRARFSRVQSSTIASTRKRRPSVNWSETKSNDQRSLGPQRHEHGGTCPDGSLAAATTPNGELFLPVEPEELLVVHG